jgi:CHAT domain-containing protein/tetratricopeptide (TPR) repeat protein
MSAKKGVLLPLFAHLRRRPVRIALGVFACLFPGTAWAQQAISKSQPLVKSGLIVESLVKTQEGDRAGIHSGDILLTWSRGSVRGDLDSPFQLFYLASEQASRGPVTIGGIRGSQKKAWVVGADDWGIWTRPNFQGDLLVLYEQALQLAEKRQLDDAVERWRKAAELARLSEPPWVAAWLLVRAARTVGPFGNSHESLFREALQQATDAGPVVRADMYFDWGYGFLVRNDLAGTQDYFEKALREWQSLGAETLAVATGYDYAAWAAEQHGNVGKAEEYHREALRIAQKVAPTSTRTLLGLTYVGGVLRKRGDFSSAETYYLKALALAERRHSRDNITARILTSLAVLDRQRGNLDAAEVRYRQALAIVKRADPQGPDGLELAGSLSDLAQCLIDKGEAGRAEYYERRALTVRQQLAPGSLAVAFSYNSLGKIARLRRDWDKAESYFQQALAISKSLAPVSDRTSEVLTGLGYVARDRGQDEQAEAYFKQALAIVERVRPSGLDHAEALGDLAGALYRRRQLDDAGKLYRQAFAELESFALGGVDDDRSRFRADHVRYYKEYVDLLVDQGQIESALEQVEASRARTLLDMLARSQIDVRHGADPVLLTRERNLRQSIARRLQDRMRMAEKRAADQQLAAIDEEVAALREEYQRLQTEIRSKSPSYAELIKPQPLNIRALQELLDPETVLLEYSLGEKRSYVWAVTDKSVDVYAVPPRAEIEEPARAVYSAMVAQSGAPRTARRAVQAGYRQSALQLSRMILDPVSSHLAGKRLLIVADEILQYVPFSALPAPGNPGAPLIAEHEIVTSPSLSVVAEIRRAGTTHPKASREVAVLADPVFDSADERVVRRNGTPNIPRSQSSVSADFSKRSLTADLLRSAKDLHLHQDGKPYFGRLIYTRQEAHEILAATPPGKAMAALDFKASRFLASSAVLSEYRIVHLATHGLLNSAHPELSGLVFSLVDERGRQQNGFLKLQDIYNLDLPVEMVVLSGCDTGLGQHIRGEGLIGLTRGFMYAGASRVVASLWSVSDRATSELMARFYRAIEREKLPPPAALRKAQIEMWKQNAWRSPYYWAAFQIQGDWK